MVWQLITPLPAAKFVLTIIASPYVGVVVIGLLAPMGCNICDATTYTVRDIAGWDISTDLGTWPNGKTFHVGDILVFQCSSSDSVEEVNKDSFGNCSTTNALQTFLNGNSSIPLAKHGLGNRLYCLGGMKLQVNVESSHANSPARAPAVPLPRPSSKSNDNSGGFSVHTAGKLQHGVVLVFLGISLGPLLLILSHT